MRCTGCGGDFCISTAKNPTCAAYQEQFSAREKYAKICGKSPDCWNVITRPAPDIWYDFYDFDTGKYDQCRMHADGSWQQEPLGESPTILEYLPDHKAGSEE